MCPPNGENEPVKPVAEEPAAEAPDAAVTEETVGAGDGQGISIVEEVPPAPPPELARIEELEGRLRSVSSAYRNLQDEMRSYQDRVRRLDEDKDRRRRGEAVTAIFEPVQNLRRSIDALKKTETPPQIAEGLDLVLGQFVDALRKLGLEEIPALGTAFDPSIHDAMGSVLVTDPAQDGFVIHVYDVGYRIGTQVIQPVRVIIGQYKEPAEA